MPYSVATYYTGSFVTTATVRAVSTRLMLSLRSPTATTTFTNLLILGSNAIGGIVSARALGPVGRGQLTVVMLWASLINVLGLLGLPSACTYYVARWPHRREALVNFFMRSAAWQAAAVSVLSGMFLWWLHLRLHLPSLLTIEYMSWAAGSGISLYGASVAQGEINFRDVNRIRIISLAAPTAPILGLALIVQLTPAEAGAAYVAPIWVSAAIGYRLLHKNCGSRDTAALTKGERHAIFSYARRNFASISSLSLNSNADQMIIGMFVPLGALGLYSVASSASSPLPSFVTSISMVGLPTVAALSGRAKVKATWRTLRRAMLPLAVIAPVCAVALPWVIPTLYGKHFSAAVLPAELLLIGTVFAALTVVTDDMLRAHGYPGFVSVTQGAGAAVTAVGALVAARRSLDAVAVASSLGYAVAFILAITRLRAITWPISHPQVAGDKRGRHRARLI
jgi:O-antigen/teichoic acid export membrane protein